MLTQPRQQPPFYQSYTQNFSIPSQGWAASTTNTNTLAPSAIPSPPQSHYDDVTVTNDVFSFGDFQSQQQYNTPLPLMPSERSNNSWLSNGQLTPSRARHHRESSLSSLGSTGPASPYTANTSNPQVAGEYHDFHDYNQSSSKPLTPVHTPLQEQFLTPHYTNFYPHSSNLAYSMHNDGLSKGMGDADLLPATEFNSNSERPSVASVASHDSPSTPPAYEMEERRNAYRTPTMSKLTRTTSDAYVDGLYPPNFQITSAPAPSTQTISVVSPQNDVFTQRLQAASHQHINASSAHLPLSIPSRERSPFRQGSPLAPSDNGFGSHQSPNYIYNSATHLRKQQKAENDARAQQHLEISSPEDTTPKTISPKDVDLVYRETEEDANAPLFPPQQQRSSPTVYRHQPMITQEPSGLDDTASQQSYASMASSRRQSSSIYPTSSQATQQHKNLGFTAPTVPSSISRQIPQQYPFVPQSRRQLSDLSNASVEFPATLQSMESSSSEYAPESSDNKRPLNTSADTGTYTCTYHGCTLRFETPAKLQRHKREGHRNSAALIANDDGSSAALRNSQNGPHKCERINPSTGKPCNTIFSRPYDLTRHEDTIHNARKQKVRCHLCTEEKTFSRNDALTRHFRVVHPEHIELAKNRRRRD